MSQAREPMQRIVVVGDGQVGVLAALACRLVLPQCEIAVLACPADRAAFADRAVTALPFTNRLHQRLGITEEDLVRQAGGSHRLITRLLGWGGEGHSGCFSYGAESDAARDADFGQRWGGGSRSDTDGAAPGSLAQILAEEGRFAPPPGGAHTPLQGVEYAMRWNMPAYRDMLIRKAQQAGIAYVQGSIAEVTITEAGEVAGLQLDQGQALEPDLYIDCSGPGAILASQIAGFERNEWSAALPIRALAFDPPGQAMLALEDRAQLMPHGWSMQIAGRDGLQIVHGLTDQNAEAANAIAFSPFALRESWIGNVVAIGDSAALFEPLGNFNLDLAHRQIDLLLELLPGNSTDPLERAEYNRRAALMADRVRDTLGVFYAAPAASDLFGDSQQSVTLSRWIDQFTRRGRLPFAEEAPLLTEELRSLLSALGIKSGPSALARASTGDGTAFTARAEAALRFAPPYGHWVQQVMGGS
ncbi:tryptophan 7-halogenase [Aurantiacibacter sp. MUD61]|uniref:tryptophan 7-halogenase n=1 Tax=Aurantiacibacter sp. MUD61 TaxID=3009083 RepID=UPI0022F052EE|nr:tryptophan 7-halogenase [Aurantiacibacter sp. MUD61]